jgi:TPR repeat protein
MPTGRGLAQDDVEALKWYRLAAEQGNTKAQVNLGSMYANGFGAPQDDAEAVKWFRSAAKQGFARAQYNLGLMYANGQGVQLDFVSAHMWLNNAAANGEPTARSQRDLIASRLSSADLSEAQRRATVCMASNYHECD